MAGYIGNTPVPQATQTRDEFIATAGQTTFATSGYSPGYLDVYLNGIHLQATDYTATNGTDIVLNEAAELNDVVLVVAWTLFQATSVDFDDILNKDDVAFDSVQLSGGTGTQGTLSFNTVEGTVDLDLGTATLQLGQEQYFFGKATEAISNGEVVMFAGAQGDHLLLAKADHDAVGFDPSYVIGVATQDFANNDFGYVTTFGKVRDLDTSGYNEGDILYFNPNTAGGLTTTKPTPPDHIIQMAAVTRSHATEGTILIRPSHTSDTDEVPEGSTNLYHTDARVQSVIDTNSAGFATTSYVDTAESDAVTTANAYTDTRETAITSAYQTYADTAESDAVATANAYTDTEIGNISVTPAGVSDQTNTSTGFFALPSGTTAQRPGSPAAGYIRHNTDEDVVETYNGTAWETVGDQSSPYTIQYLVVAGAGAGGSDRYGPEGRGSGGGGAGGYISTSIDVSPGVDYSITIGAGGAGNATADTPGGNGSSSSAFGTSAVGGGGGGSHGTGANNDNAQSGGSGGGATNGRPGGSGTSGQGNSGGNGSGSPTYNGGGGGGAGGAGVTGTGSNNANGGPGSTWLDGNGYAGGGGAGSTPGGNGQAGGGDSNAGGTGGAGNPNSGSGGGGGRNAAGGAGGSGVVIVRYAGGQRGSGGTVTSSGGYTYHKFISSGTYTA